MLPGTGIEEMYSNASSGPLKDSSEEEGKREHTSSRGRQRLTFQPAIDDHAELTAYLRRVNEQYNAHRAIILRNESQGPVQPQGEPASAQIRQQTNIASASSSQGPGSQSRILAIATDKKPPPTLRGLNRQALITEEQPLQHDEARTVSSVSSPLPGKEPHPEPSTAPPSSSQEFRSRKLPPKPSTSTTALKSPSQLPMKAAASKPSQSLKKKTPREGQRKADSSSLKSQETLTPASSWKNSPAASDKKSSSSSGSHLKPLTAAASVKKTHSLKVPPRHAGAAAAAPKRSPASKKKAAGKRKHAASSTSKDEASSAAAAVLDEDTRARIKRVQAKKIDFYAPDPEQDPPPGETEDERRKRLERIIGRRKRAKKFIEIDQYNKNISELSESNQKLQAENQAFRGRIDLIKQMLENRETPDRDLLCLPEEIKSSQTEEKTAAQTEMESEDQPQAPPEWVVMPQHALGSDRSANAPEQRGIPSLPNIPAASRTGSSLFQPRTTGGGDRSLAASLDVASTLAAAMSNLNQGGNQRIPHAASLINQNMPQFTMGALQNQQTGFSAAATLPEFRLQHLVSPHGGRTLTDVTTLLLQHRLLGGSGTGPVPSNAQPLQWQQHQHPAFSSHASTLRQNNNNALADTLAQLQQQQQQQQRQQPPLMNLLGSGGGAGAGAGASLTHQQMEELYALLQRQRQQQTQNQSHRQG